MAKLSTNPNYLFTIQCQDQNIEVTANLPEKIDFAVEGQWESRFPYQTLAQIFGFVSPSIQSKLEAASNIGFGGQIFSQPLSVLTWQGSGPVTINLELLFDAETDAYSDVVSPMLDLARLCMPIAGSYGLLYPPGPSPVNRDKNKNQVFFGSYFSIDSVVVVSVTNTFDTRLDATGNPISGMSQVVIRSIYTPSRDDLLRWFYQPTSGSLSGIGAPAPAFTSSSPSAPPTATTATSTAVAGSFSSAVANGLSYNPGG